MAAVHLALAAVVLGWTQHSGIHGLISVALNTTLIDTALVAIPAVTVARLGLVWHAWDTARPRHLRMTGLQRATTTAGLVVGVALTVAPSMIGWTTVSSYRAALGAVFEPPAATSTATSTPGATTSTTALQDAPWRTGERWNVLLIGGDAGPDRESVRTDSMVLASVDVAGGDIALISVPRNLEGLRFSPGPLADAFPQGFDDLANAVYRYGDEHPELTPAATDHGAAALMSAMAELTGLEIDTYVRVDMLGFLEVIDALGGIDVTTTERIDTAAALVPGADVPRVLGPGPLHLDGDDALAFVRSRTGNSDYSRMARQRCLLETAVRDLKPSLLLTQFQTLADIANRTVRTNIATADVPDLLAALTETKFGEVRQLGLNPPLIRPADWDPDEIRELVAETIKPTPAPSSTVPSSIEPVGDTTLPTVPPSPNTTVPPPPPAPTCTPAG